ncbi:3-hydroxybutyryl-CoA dehydrogenase; 3-hydroxyacyl-CoA dehydrogenase [hydrothermal vent metagenome]|uniref:3-hydroxybutyryl-CoA dehydrogenase 3-hydroxyacyl-CoA dehydrogenase n=1 Tax=hydrothermal vent metagenome TaxID=652676 RepID=A0A3B1B403_9ZZZZ
MKRIKAIGVVGAGTMGAAIAQHFLMKNLSVTLLDQSEDSIKRGQNTIMDSLKEAMKRRIISEAQFDKIMSNLTCTTDQSALKDADLVVEAIFEDLAVKQGLFSALETIVRPDCILASNTSSFLIKDIAEGAAHPERIIGVHYFYHAAKNKLVEIIPGPKTDEALVGDLVNFYSYHGKIPIIVKDAPGFAINRFFVPWLNEAARLLEEGCGSIKFIDDVARKVFAIGMGPFALMNATGVPIAMHAADGLASKLGNFYKPAQILISQVQSGNLWDETDTTILNDGANDEERVTSRLLASALGIAAQMVSEGVVDATSNDLGTRAGLRWPMGPFELMNKIGVDKVAVMVKDLFATWHMPLPKFAFGGTDAVTLEWVRAEKQGNTGFIIFNLPDRMNALGELVVRQLDDCFSKLDQDPDLKRIFMLGQGKAFVAGADIKFFLDGIASNDLERIHKFTEFGQKVLNKIQNSPKDTCAFVDGLTLGGGLELALACDYRIGTKNTVMAFPETGIGIYPGLGGTQRTSRLIGKGMAKFLISTGQFLDTNTAYKYGLLDQIIDPLYDFHDLADLSLDKKQGGKIDQSETEALFADFTGAFTADHPYTKVLSRKAPIALSAAMKLIDDGAGMSLEDGLKLELSGLKEIFSTRDAATGLSSVVKGFKPEFAGE